MKSSYARSRKRNPQSTSETPPATDTTDELYANWVRLAEEACEALEGGYPDYLEDGALLEAWAALKEARRAETQS